MPASNPLVDPATGVGYALYNTGQTSGMNSGTTQSAAGSATLSSGSRSAAAATVGGNANVTVAALVGVALIIMIGFHALGFRFAFDASVGRK